MSLGYFRGWMGEPLEPSVGIHVAQNSEIPIWGKNLAKRKKNHIRDCYGQAYVI